jgi:uncharacterized membrane protein
MQKNHAILAGIVIVFAMSAGIVEGVRVGNPTVPVIAILAGPVILILISRSIDAVAEDAWTRLVDQKAATPALNATMILFTFSGLVPITVSSPHQDYDQAVYPISAVLIILSGVQVAATAGYLHTLRGTPP